MDEDLDYKGNPDDEPTVKQELFWEPPDNILPYETDLISNGNIEHFADIEDPLENCGSSLDSGNLVGEIQTEVTANETLDGGSVLEKTRQKGSAAARAESEQCKCPICELSVKPFSALSLKEKIELLTVGRPTPGLKNLSQSTKSFIRHFKSDNYIKYEWLTGCPKKKRLFCWPCLLFSLEKTTWTETGYNDLGNLPKLLRRHPGSRDHLFSMIKMKSFCQRQPQTDLVLRDSLRLQDEEHNKLVKSNRCILQRLIDAVCFLAEHEVSLHGLNKSKESYQNRSYKDLVELIAKYDEPLKSHLDNNNVFQYTSIDFQNDLIKSLGIVVHNRIKEELQDTSFVSVILDETSDTSDDSLLSVVLRYFFKGKVKERFIRFHDVSAGRDATSIYKKVKQVMDDFNCGDKLAAQSYDGASVLSEHLSALEAKVKKTYPNAVFIHCMAHRLSSVLEQSVSKIAECQMFFSTLRSIASFFSKTGKRSQALNLYLRERFPKHPLINWNYNGRLVSTVFKCREPLIEFFENIVESSGNRWDSETKIAAENFSDLLKTDFNFNFFLVFFADLFLSCDVLYDTLLREKVDIWLCVSKVNEFRDAISAMRYNIHEVWIKTNNLDLEPSRKRARLDIDGDNEVFYKNLYYEVVDIIASQVEARFGNFDELKFLDLINFKKYKSINETALDYLKENYGKRFDLILIRTQLFVVYNTTEVLSKVNVSELYQSLKNSGLDEDFSEVVKLCELVLTIPAPGTTTGHSFSALNRIQTYIKNSSGQDRLSYLALLSIEKELLREMRKEPSFYDTVIDEFAKTEGREALVYR